MFAFISGNLHSKTPTEAIIDCNGVGYRLYITLHTYESLPEEGSNVFLHTVNIVREDSNLLYGFQTPEEMALFKLLISISGIGAKIAIGILSSVSTSDLHSAILQNNIAKLTKLPGVGKKTANLMVIHLGDKLAKLDIGEGMPSEPQHTDNNILAEEAISALVALGYSQALAEKAVKKSEKDFLASDKQNVETLIKIALKFVMK